LGVGKEIALRGDEYFVQKAEAFLNDLSRGGDVQAKPVQLQLAGTRWRVIPGEQQRLTVILQRFLRRTLVILSPLF
jgi:hypothetical protein